MRESQFRDIQLGRPSMPATVTNDAQDSARHHRLNLSAGFASILVSSLLVLSKLWAGYVTGSLAVATSFVDSVLDLLASTGGLAAIIYAARPPDAKHGFGHGSIEDLVALGQALLVTGSAGYIAWRAIGRISAPPPLAAEGLGLAVMAGGMVLTLALVLWQSHVARRTGSRIVAADRLHYLSDLLPAIGAMIALAGAARGHAWLDPVIAIIACLLLLRGAIGIGAPAWNALMDARADPALIRRIERILGEHPGVRGFHDLRTRTAGTRVFVQVHVELDGDQSLDEAHAIAAELRLRILEMVPEADVIIHMDPV